MSTPSDRPDLTQAVLREVGPRLRAARVRRDLTLGALAQRTGISASTLSRLEGGKRTPNLELLLPVTRALGIGLDDLLMWHTTDARPTARVRRLHGLTVEHLSSASASVQVLRMTLAPTEQPIRTRQYEGHQWVHVLHGSARVVIGERDLHLEAGQSAEFDTRLPHGVAARGAEPVEILSIFHRGAERGRLPGPGLPGGS